MPPSDDKNTEVTPDAAIKPTAAKADPAPTPEAEPPEETPPMGPLTIASSPHARSDISTNQIMWTVFLALLPATVFSIYTFGMPAALVLATCTGGAVVFEALCQWIAKRQTSVQDGSAALTGLLLGLTMPPGASIVICLIGAFVAIVIAKQVFGGLGHNPFNPALTARVFLLIAFPGPMTQWPLPLAKAGAKLKSLYGQDTTWLDVVGNKLDFHAAAAKGEAALTALADKVDIITGASPLALAKEMVTKGASATKVDWCYWDLAMGNTTGSLGETSALLLLLGGLILLLRKIITWHIPVAFVVGCLLIAGPAHLLNPDRYIDPLFHLITGGIIIGAFFMATDYVTSPTYTLGMIIFGLGCGILTMVIRFWGGFPEGVSFAILIMNAATPLIERYTRPKKFGSKPWAEPEVSS